MGYTTWSQDFQETNRKIQAGTWSWLAPEAFRATCLFDLGAIFGLMTTFFLTFMWPFQSSVLFYFDLLWQTRSHSPSLPERAQNTLECDLLFSTSAASGEAHGVKSLLSGAFPFLLLYITLEKESPLHDVWIFQMI